MEIFNIKNHRFLGVPRNKIFRRRTFYNTDNFRIYKGKPAKKIRDKIPLWGTGFAIHNSVLDSVIEFTSPSERISLLSIKAANKAYTLINVHAPTNHYNKTYPESVDEF